MTKLSEIVKQPEGRKVEFKVTIPTNADLVRTIIEPIKFCKSTYQKFEVKYQSGSIHR